MITAILSATIIAVLSALGVKPTLAQMGLIVVAAKVVVVAGITGITA